MGLPCVAVQAVPETSPGCAASAVWLRSFTCAAVLLMACWWRPGLFLFLLLRLRLRNWLGQTRERLLQFS